MIIQWRKSGPTELVAMWQGHSLSLQFIPSPIRPPWVVYVDGIRVTTITGRRADWWTPQAAIEDMDAAANRLVMKAGATAHAEQRPLSGDRIMRHGL